MTTYPSCTRYGNHLPGEGEPEPTRQTNSQFSNSTRGTPRTRSSFHLLHIAAYLQACRGAAAPLGRQFIRGENPVTLRLVLSDHLTPHLRERTHNKSRKQNPGASGGWFVSATLPYIETPRESVEFHLEVRHWQEFKAAASVYKTTFCT